MDLVGQSEQGLKGTVHPKNPKHITLPVVSFIVHLGTFDANCSVLADISCRDDRLLFNIMELGDISLVTLKKFNSDVWKSLLGYSR